jgi:hypothetical protein
MLSSAERTSRPPEPLVLQDIIFSRYKDTRLFPVDIVTISHFPRRAAHAKLAEKVRPAADLISAVSGHNDRTKRIMREVVLLCSKTSHPDLIIFSQLKAVMADPHPQMDVYVNDSDISFLKIILEVGRYNVVTISLICLFYLQGPERRGFEITVP